MKEILLAHLKQYPQMQLQDVVKLLYQSEFGGGHMITSPEKSLDRLKEEYKSFKWEYSPIICEPIGGEMYRIYLSALEDGLSEETLNRMFTETAARASGTREGFEEKLRCLLQCCRSESFRSLWLRQKHFWIHTAARDIPPSVTVAVTAVPIIRPIGSFPPAMHAIMKLS